MTAERSTAEQAAAARVWYIAEPDVGTTRVAWRRAADYEAACGFALASCALTTVCAYPRSMFGPVLETVRRTHPRLLTADGPVPNPAYRDVLPAGLGNGPALPEPAGSPVLHIAGSVTLAEVAGIRARLAEALRDVPALVRTDFVAAVNEVLTNAYLHGIPPVDLTVWASAAWIEGRVTDRGRGFTDPLAGYVPESDGRRAHAGLWLVRQACDEFDTWRTPAGFTVRVATPVTADLRLYTAGR
ncbi:ATP-binding protein [Hamadaea tsunoensis]|uniref:ATP-binding protein n=1 Tax=Hamadaea tsunoensis TaxID=53368 RepID=UPI0038992EA7